MAKMFTITEGLENMGALRTGGQGSVYKARRLGEIITAVKILPTPIYNESPDDKHYSAFQNEVNKLKRVNANPNPNVVNIISSGITESGSLPFIEMEYVEGPDLEELLQTPHDPVFTIREAIKVADQLSNALAHCHNVNVKHGDIKANNVKFNVNTGNYVLLDFGMAMLSDEQRRTSMRQAGAIEFMAPEQSEGHILFQTDIYSFGVVLFELLAGQVPFPLTEKGEMARNQVMLAHMEKEPPDLLALRKNALPVNWSNDQKDAEMLVPEWLVNTIYICLQKKPEKRFNNGKALHDYIALRNTKTITSITGNNELYLLQKEKEQLLKERAQLQEQVRQLQSVQNASSHAAYEYPTLKKRSSLVYILIFLAIIIAAVFFFYNKLEGSKAPRENKVAVVPKTPLGEYRVMAARAYFYDQPDLSARRSAFMVPSDEVITALDDQNGFIYTEFKNSRGQESKGWLRKSDLVTLDQWNAQQKNAPLTPDEINAQLGAARRLMILGKVKDALYIYNTLAAEKVPEAMYEYGNLGLQRKNDYIDCGQAFLLVKDAGDRGYVPAKRTLGFLYVFADNEDVLRINNYQNCSYERNVFKGTKLLAEAALYGDTTAKRLMDEINVHSNSPDSTAR